MERNSILELQHNASSQAERLRPHLRSRNMRMVGPGQEQWNHVCDLCCWIEEDDDGSFCELLRSSFSQFLTEHIGQIRSTVTDGITIGHPCCAVHDCSAPLSHVKKRFCQLHEHLDAVCTVTTCTNIAEMGFRTCMDPEHRKLEVNYYQQGKAMFQLKHHLKRAKISQTCDSLSLGGLTKTRLSGDNDEELLPDLVPAPDDDDDNDLQSRDHDIGEGSGTQDDDDEVFMDEEGVCDGKPETGNRSVRARFGRRCTHNEELCVGSCGIILGHATFFGSEAPNGVRVSL